MLGFLFGLALGAAGEDDAYARGRRDGQGPGRCHSTKSFAGGEDVWRCRLTAGHEGEHRGIKVGDGK